MPFLVNVVDIVSSSHSRHVGESTVHCSWFDIHAEAYSGHKLASLFLVSKCDG